MPKLYDEEKPVKKSEGKEVSLWHERKDLAKKSQESWSEESGAKRFIKEYKGKYDIVFQTRTRKVPIPPINEVFSYVQSDIATTYSRDPYITVNAEAGSPRGAAFWEAILNYYWRELKTKEELEYEIIDKDLVGFGWHKVGWAVQSIGKGDTLKIDSEKLYSNFVSWKDVIWNIGSKRPPVDCEWMAQRIVLPLKDLKAKYPAAKGLEGSPTPDLDDESYKKSSYKDDIKVGVIWEIWDKREKKIRLIAEGLKDRYLEAPKPWPDYLDEFPFLMYFDFINPQTAYPMSAIAPWEAQILEEMVIMGSAINHVKIGNRQLFIKRGVIDEGELDKFEQGYDGAVLASNGELTDANFRFSNFAPLPADFYLLMDRLQAIKRNINGQPEFVKGGVTKTGTRTIGELQLMQAGNQSRQDRKIDRLETHLENIARHMMFHLKANFDFEQSIKITGDTPEEIIELLGENFNTETGEVKFTPEDIEGEYDVDVKAGSTLPLNKENRMQALEIVLQTVAQVVAQGPMSPFLNALIQELLKDYDIKGLQEAYKLEVAQAEQARAEAQGQQSIEDQKTQAEAEKRRAQARKVDAETEKVGLETQKVGVEIGKVGAEAEIEAQEAEIGPFGRAAMKKLEKPNPRPNGNKP